MAAVSDPVVCDGQVEDQAAVPCRVLEIALDFHVAAPLACAGRHLVLSGPCVQLSSPTSPVASGSGWGSQPPPPPTPMGGVGGSGMVRARIAALEAATGAVGGAATGAVASRTYPLLPLPRQPG